MGTEYFIVDMAGRRVLDIHKSGWIMSLDPGVGHPTVTADDVRRVFRTDPGGRCHQQRVLDAVLTWMEEVATGPVSVWGDYRDPCPFEDDRGYLLDDWSGWVAFTGGEDEWTLWGLTDWSGWECPDCGAYSGCSHYHARETTDEPMRRA